MPCSQHCRRNDDSISGNLFVGHDFQAWHTWRQSDADAGEFDAGEGGLADGCAAGGGVAWFSMGPAAMHMVPWTAPEGSECVTVSTAQAAGPTDYYHTASVRIVFGALHGQRVASSIVGLCALPLP